MIRCLYETSNDSPNYKEIAKYFGLSGKNIGGVKNINSKNSKAKEVVELLEKCGFANVDVFNNPYPKKAETNASER